MIAQEDDASEVQKARIRDKVTSGQLPRAVGAFALGSPAGAALGRGLAASSGALCDACDEAGAARTFAGLRWHDACFAFWQAMTARIDG